MKKLAVSMGVTTLFVLLFAQFAPAAAVTLKDVTGYSLENDKFAVTLDMNQAFYNLVADPENFAPDENRVKMTGDLENPSNPKIVSPDPHPNDDQEFYVAYANMGGIQTAYNALMNFYHNVSAAEVLDTFWDDIGVSDILPTGVDRDLLLSAAAGTYIGEIDATAPFQTLVEHWRTPNEVEMGVANSYVALMAYSTTAEDRILGNEDNLFLGYTFALNLFRDAVNQFIDANTAYGQNFVPKHTATPYWKPLDNNQGYEFGIRYTNLFVVWQAIDALKFGETGAVIYGNDIAAASLLDSLDFTYTFTTEEKIDALTGEPFIQADIQTEYDFGETNLLIIRESAPPSGGEWTDTFSTSDGYPLNLGTISVNVPLVGSVDVPIPPFTVPLPDLTFYLNDDAKRRIGHDDGGYGITMTTMTNAFAVGLTPATPTTADHNVTETIDILAGSDKVFETNFANKLSYQLSELPADMGGNGAYNAIIETYPATHNYAENIGKFYFKIEAGLAAAFLYLLARETGLVAAAEEGWIVDLERTNAYFTLTEYWKWDGGDIDHDPTYTAISGAEKDGDGTDTATESSAGDFVPGFEFLVVALAAIPLVIYKKRK